MKRNVDQGAEETSKDSEDRFEDFWGYSDSRANHVAHSFGEAVFSKKAAAIMIGGLSLIGGSVFAKYAGDILDFSEKTHQQVQNTRDQNNIPADQTVLEYYCQGVASDAAQTSIGINQSTAAAEETSNYRFEYQEALSKCEQDNSPLPSNDFQEFLNSTAKD